MRPLEYKLQPVGVQWINSLSDETLSEERLMNE